MVDCWKWNWPLEFKYLDKVVYISGHINVLEKGIVLFLLPMANWLYSTKKKKLTLCYILLVAEGWLNAYKVNIIICLFIFTAELND